PCDSAARRSVRLRSPGWRDPRRQSPVCRERAQKDPHHRPGASFSVNLENRLPALNVRPADDHAPVEPAGPQQRRIEHVRPVGRRHQDYAFVRFEPVHLHEQLVQRLLTFVVAAAEPGAAVAPDGVNFVDKDDAWRILFALLEQVAHAAGAYTYKHLYKVRTGD